jgi:hypothetical protein
LKTADVSQEELKNCRKHKKQWRPVQNPERDFTWDYLSGIISTELPTFQPSPVAATTMAGFAALGLVVRNKIALDEARPAGGCG